MLSASRRLHRLLLYNADHVPCAWSSGHFTAGATEHRLSQAWSVRAVRTQDRWFRIRRYYHRRGLNLPFLMIFSERTTLRSLYAISRPSVVCCLSSVCLSVTLVHPTQAVELFGNFFHLTIAQGLYFFGAKNHWWGTPLSP